VAHCKAGLACRGADDRTRNVLLITLANVQEVAGDYVSAAAARSEMLRVKGAPQTSTCAVCMEDIQPAKPSTRGGANPAATALEVQQCRHIMHRSCMDKWAEQQKRLGSSSLSCPTCRGVASRDAGRTGPSDAVPAPAGAPPLPPLALRAAQLDEARWIGGGGVVPFLCGPLATLPSGCSLSLSMGRAALEQGPSVQLLLAVLPEGELRSLPLPPMPAGAEASRPAMAAMGSDVLFSFGGGDVDHRDPADARSAQSAELCAITLRLGGDGFPVAVSSVALVPLLGAKSGKRAPPHARCAAAAAAHEGVFYVFGGAAQNPQTTKPDPNLFYHASWDLFAFKPADPSRPAAGGAWRSIPLSGSSPPFDAGAGGVPGLQSAAQVVRGRELVLLGGRFNWAYSASVFIVDLPTGAVRCLAPSSLHAVPRPRLGAFAARLPDGRILLGGGADQRSNTDDAWAFDTATHVWARVRCQEEGGVEFRMRSQALAAPLSGGRVLVWGGMLNALPASSAALNQNPSDNEQHITSEACIVTVI